MHESISFELQSLINTYNYQYMRIVDTVVKILFLANLLFWFGIFVHYLFLQTNTESSCILIVILIALEPVLYLVSFIGYQRKRKSIYIASLVFMFFNSILSLTDEV